MLMAFYGRHTAGQTATTCLGRGSIAGQPIPFFSARL